MKTLRSLANTQMWNQPRKIYYVHDEIKGIDEVGGFYRTDDDAKITLISIPKSGHFVPATQLLASKNFLKDIWQNGKLLCHKGTDPKECDTGPIMCHFMNNCSSHGTCNDSTGKCVCIPGFGGADCATQLVILPSDGSSYQQSFPSFGFNWIYFTLSNTNLTPFTFTISSSNPMDIFINADTSNDPTGDDQADLELKQ